MDMTPRHEEAQLKDPRSSVAAAPRRKRMWGGAVLAVLALAAAAGGVARWQHWWPFRQEQHAAPPPPVPVSTSKAERKPVPILLTGLGSVQAYNTVTVRSRVDGQLIRVAYTEGQDVKKGDLLAEIDPHPFEAQLAQAQAKFAQDTATLRDAELNRDRYAALAKTNDVARSQLDTQEATVQAQRALVQADQAAIAYAGVQLGYTKIVSPIDGRTGVRLVDVGNVVHAADAGGLVVVTQLQPIFVVFSLPQDKLEDLRRAMAASEEPLQVQAFGRDKDAPLATGKLDLVNNQVNQQTGTVDLKASFANDDHALWPGQFVTAKLQLSVRQDGIVIPAAAVQRGAEGTFVFTVGTDGKAQKKNVDVALQRDDFALINTGIDTGETVITSGQFKVKPGAVVRDAKADDGQADSQKTPQTTPGKESAK